MPIHYEKGDLMKTKTVLKVNAVIFGIVAVVHLLRLLRGGTMMMGSWMIPSSASIVGLLLAGWLCYENWKAAN